MPTMRTLATVLLMLASAATGGCKTGRDDHTAPAAARCDTLAERVATLYRAGATGLDAEAAERHVADGVAMVLADCAREPARVAPCVVAAADVATLERTCLIPLDDEGSEGDRFRAR